tara:strand:+ start:1345 stop:1584 length:240 start_codon:yes stop_codon:yes gene_type:complete
MAVMKDIIQKQILEWKEELAKQIQTKNQAEKVLTEASKTILLIEGGIQATEMLLKKIEQEYQQEDTKELKQQSEPIQSN